MQDEYKLHIENHTVLPFHDLMEKMENTEEIVSKICKDNQAEQDTTDSWYVLVKKQKIVTLV